MLLNGEDAEGEHEKKRGDQLGENDENLDKSSSSGSSELLDLKFIFKIEPTGLTESLDVGCERKKKSQE